MHNCSFSYQKCISAIVAILYLHIFLLFCLFPLRIDSLFFLKQHIKQNQIYEFENKNVYMAGFGRRQTPHCLTDMQGPEKFQVFLTFFTIYLYIHQNSFAWQRHRLNILHLCFSFADVRHGVNTSIEEKIVGSTFLIRMVMKKM